MTMCILARARWRVALLVVAVSLVCACGLKTGAAGMMEGLGRHDVVLVAQPPGVETPTRVPPLAALVPGRALLLSGSTLVKGLPGFGHNALPALAGQYACLPGRSGAQNSGTRTAGTEPRAGEAAAGDPLTLRVWMTRVPLVYPPDWKPGAPRTCPAVPAGFSAVAFLVEPEGGILWAFDYSGPSAGQEGARHSVLIGIPEAMAEPCTFVSAFLEKLGFFMRRAERPEDLSFPAMVELNSQPLTGRR